MDTNPKTQFGMLKPSLSVVPTTALLHLSAAMKNGAQKYGAYNWRGNSVSWTIYYDAAMRHLMAAFDREERDPDSGCVHLGHVMACCAILLDAIETGNVVDDRPIQGAYRKVCDAMTEAPK